MLDSDNWCYCNHQRCDTDRARLSDKEGSRSPNGDSQARSTEMCADGYDHAARRIAAALVGVINETCFVSTIRRATARDGAFLQEMLAIAADWRPDAYVRSVTEIMGQPELAHYVAGWPQERDVGFVVEDGRPVGASWWRFFPEQDPGYGFVDGSTPEVSIGIVAAFRRRGFGTLLLEALIDEGRRHLLPAMSLGVEPDNPAVVLYERLGFVNDGGVGGSLTMILKVQG